MTVTFIVPAFFLCFINVVGCSSVGICLCAYLIIYIFIFVIYFNVIAFFWFTKMVEEETFLCTSRLGKTYPLEFWRT